MHFRILLPKNTPLEQHRTQLTDTIRATFAHPENCVSDPREKALTVNVTFDISLEPPNTHVVVIMTMRTDENGRETTIAAKEAAKTIANHFKLELEFHTIRSDSL